MCRNFNVFLKPISIEDLFFDAANEHGQHLVRSREAIQLDLLTRIAHACAIAEDCSKKSTKAGYDAGGMAVGIIPLDTILAYIERRRCQSVMLSSTEMAEVATTIQDQLLTHVRISRDGGDLLKTWESLKNNLKLSDTEFIVNWETHVRQASQGDMYSESNAHPHQEVLENGKVRIYHLTSTGEITFIQGERARSESLFADTHNGDINDATQYKQFLAHEGFHFVSNSDSCVEPALKRFIYEHLQVNELAGALHRLAYTDPDFINNDTVVVDSNGCIGVKRYLVGREWANQTLAVAVDRDRVTFSKNERRAGEFIQRGFLRDDRRGLARDKIADLLTLARIMDESGAEKVTLAAALVARIMEYSHSKNKFVFQSFAPIGKSTNGYLGGGTYTTVRGGSEKGGEEGGEIVIHIPKPYDERNYNRVALLSASEENALKEQVALLDLAALVQGQIQLAQPEVLTINSLPGFRATAYITEGVMPIFDVLPGEIVEVTADGQVKLFDIYRGLAVPLMPLDHHSFMANPTMHASEMQQGRRERLASLKVFKINYRDLDDQPVLCPYNKYGEEMIVIQPLALRRNTEKLFATTDDGTIRLRTGVNGIGLTMGDDDEVVRSERIKRLTHIITGAAGTSYLINNIAPSIVRKLGLNTLPIINFDAFTGSDTIPPYVDESTLFLANSNSGGTSDTIKFAHELASPLGVLSRIEAETLRRDHNSPEVKETLKGLSEIHVALKAGVEWENLPTYLRDFVAKKTPWVYVITNIEASALGNIGKGLDCTIQSAAGSGITNLPEEECVGSTFAAMASLQWQIALYTHIGEIRGDISPDYAARIYGELSLLSEVAEQIVGDVSLVDEIKRMADELVGGNYDFVYTDYLEGIPEEQAHKAAEMIQEMFAGWHYFHFQHGKYAHMKRRTRHTLGSILGHNVPPPSWPFFNARGLKAPNEIGPRVATSFFIVHESDREALRGVPDYAPDYIFSYPVDSIVLYPFQTVIIGQLISYFWGLKKKEIGQQIEEWNRRFINILLRIPHDSSCLPSSLHAEVEVHAQYVLGEFLVICETKHYFDNIEGRRRMAIINALSLLSGKSKLPFYQSTYFSGGMLCSEGLSITLREDHWPADPLDNTAYLSVLKDLALELSNGEQAKQLADHFLVDGAGRAALHKIAVARPQGRARMVYEYDYLVEYEGLGTFYDVEPVHPPKIAKAKKGWL